MKNNFTQLLSRKILFLVIIFAFSHSFVMGQEIIYQAKDLRGDFTMTGNSIITFKDPAYRENSEIDNDNVKWPQIDFINIDERKDAPIDDESSTVRIFNSSSANIKFKTVDGPDNKYRPNPQCSRIVFAGLFWAASGGLEKDQLYNYKPSEVLLKGPNASSYKRVTAKKLVGKPGSYIAFADVTDYVRKQSEGRINTTDGDTYTVANISSPKSKGNPNRGGGEFAAWSLYVVYENEKMQDRNIYIYDLAGNVFQDGLAFSGFKTLPTGDVKAKIGLFVAEGDNTEKDDIFAIQDKDGTWHNLEHGKNTKDNYFGNHFVLEGNTIRNPTYTNNIGIDLVEQEIDNTGNKYIGNSQESVSFKLGGALGSAGDGLIPVAFGLGIETAAPQLIGVTNVNSIGGGSTSGGAVKTIGPGEKAIFEMDIYNRGRENVLNGVVYIPIPRTAEYVDIKGVDGGETEFEKAVGDNFKLPIQIDGKDVEAPGGYIKWTLPPDLPAKKENEKAKVLAHLKYEVKTTNDCFYLRGETGCSSLEILSKGYMDGIGAISRRRLSEKRESVDKKLFDSYIAKECKLDEFPLASTSIDIQKVATKCELPTNKVICSREKLEIPKFVFAEDGLDESHEKHKKTTYKWSYATPSGVELFLKEGKKLSPLTVTGTTQDGQMPVITATNHTDKEQEVIFTITPYRGECEGTPASFTLTVKPEPWAKIPPPPQNPFCSKEEISFRLRETIPNSTIKWKVVDENNNTIVEETEATGGRRGYTISFTAPRNLTNKPKKFTLELTVSNQRADVCPQSSTVTETFEVNPELMVDIKPDKTCADGGDVNFTVKLREGDFEEEDFKRRGKVEAQYELIVNNESKKNGKLVFSSADASHKVTAENVTGTAVLKITKITKDRRIRKDDYCDTPDGEEAVVYTVDANCPCSKEPVTGVAADTFVGISTLNRRNANWNMAELGAYIALESGTKGFVITRNADPEANINPAKEGMIVWDTTEKCLKIYSDKETPGTFKWNCIKQGCNE